MLHRLLGQYLVILAAHLVINPLCFLCCLESLIQADGDLGGLEMALGKKDPRRTFGSGSCSALIKLLPGNKDLYISQVTWNSYSSMLRIFKLYDIPLTVAGSKGE